MRFLLSNDDGIQATGLAVLERVVSPLGSIDVVAPDRERSGAGHSLTLHHPLRVAEISKGHWAVSGTPTDCVLLALEELLPERPDRVLSDVGAQLGLCLVALDDDPTKDGDEAGLRHTVALDVLPLLRTLVA